MGEFSGSKAENVLQDENEERLLGLTVRDSHAHCSTNSKQS